MCMLPQKSLTNTHPQSPVSSPDAGSHIHSSLNLLRSSLVTTTPKPSLPHPHYKHSLLLSKLMLQEETKPREVGLWAPFLLMSPTTGKFPKELVPPWHPFGLGGGTDLVGRGRRGDWGGVGTVQGDRTPAAASVSEERVRSEWPQHPPLRPGRPSTAGNLSCSLRRKEREPRRSQPPLHSPPPPPHPLDLNVQGLPRQQYVTHTCTRAHMQVRNHLLSY